MMAQTFGLKWGRVVAAGVLATVLAFAAVFLVVAVYAASLAAWAQGAPDPDQIARFAEGTGAWLGPVLALLFTAGAAWLVARSVDPEAATRHGLVVGSAVGLIVVAVDLGFGGTFGVGHWRGSSSRLGRAGWANGAGELSLPSTLPEGGCIGGQGEGPRLLRPGPCSLRGANL